jgi:hypothetical protein
MNLRRSSRSYWNPPFAGFDEHDQQNKFSCLDGVKHPHHWRIRRVDAEKLAADVEVIP